MDIKIKYNGIADKKIVKNVKNLRIFPDLVLIDGKKIENFEMVEIEDCNSHTIQNIHSNMEILEKGTFPFDPFIMSKKVIFFDNSGILNKNIKDIIKNKIDNKQKYTNICKLCKIPISDDKEYCDECQGCE